MIYVHRDVGYNRNDKGQCPDDIEFSTEQDLLIYLKQRRDESQSKLEENFYIKDKYVLMGKDDLKFVIGFWR